MSRSPIDIMIDQTIANGQWKSVPMVTLRCPRCHRTKRVVKDRTDPKRAAYIEAPCDLCDRGGDKPETTYWDSLNLQLNPATGKPFAKVKK